MHDLGPLRAFLTRLLSQHRDHARFADEDSLLQSNRLDSMDIMEIAFFLEEHYGIEFDVRGINPHELDSVAKISELLAAE